MGNYNVICKVLRGGQGEIEQKIENYLATVDETRKFMVFRLLDMVRITYLY